ncbi:MAG: hypothetical protein AB1757_00575 [Acidobacteriota bacterium]
MSKVIKKVKQGGMMSLEIVLGCFLVWIVIAAWQASPTQSASVKAANAAGNLLAISGTSPSPSFQMVCLQDDSNGNTISIDTTTGFYCFSGDNFSLQGTGSVTIKGSTLTLQHFTSNRRVLAYYDDTQKRGSASAQSGPATIVRTIASRNTTNDVCSGCASVEK